MPTKANMVIANEVVLIIVFINELKEETNDILNVVYSEQFLEKKMREQEEK
jgi:hypothetical protein